MISLNKTKSASSSKRKYVALEVSLSVNNNIKGPNLSRKLRRDKLYPFPSFDRCDSLLFFPSTFTKCLNSGDISSFRSLIVSRIDSLCSISLCDLTISGSELVTAFELMNDLHPDTVMCVHTSKVVGNEIRSSIYFKFTDNKKLNKLLLQSYPDQQLATRCSGLRGNQMKLDQFLSTKSFAEKVHLQSLLDAEDVLVYGRSDMTLSFDPHSKRVTGLCMDCEVTSFDAVA